MISWPELYAWIAYRSGWTIPHIREALDLPTLDAMREQWQQYPPLAVMVASYLGVARPKKDAQNDLERLEDQPYFPVNTLPANEFDALLASMGLPTGKP